jgi:hypothetical protein
MSPPSYQRLSPAVLASDPELATLAALDVLLAVSTASLQAVHQDIGQEIPPHRLTQLACSIIDSATNLRTLLRQYRRTLGRHHRSIPF